MDLRPDQFRAAEALASRPDLLLIAPMGAGKSVIAMTAAYKVLARGSVERILVLAPPNVARFSWVQEAARWPHLRGLPIRYIGPELPPKRRLEAFQRPLPGITVTSLYLLQWLRDQHLIGEGTPFEALIVDEMSKARAPRGALSKLLRRLAPKLKLRWGLTGTPRPTNQIDLWAQVQFVSGNKAFDPRYDVFLREWCEPLDYNQYTWRIRPTREDAFRRRVADFVHVILPRTAGTMALIEVDHRLVLPHQQAAALHRLHKHAVAELDPALVRKAVNRPDEMTRTEVVALTRAQAVGMMGQVLQGFLYTDDEDGGRMVGNRYYTPPVKYQEVADICEQTDENLLIAYTYVAERDMLRQAVPGVTFLSDDPAQAVRAWNAGEVRALALHPASAGHGLNLQYGGRRLIFAAVPWSPELYAQTCFRIARPGQTGDVYVHRIVFDHWLEQVRLARLKAALAEQQAEIERLHEEAEGR